MRRTFTRYIVAFLLALGFGGSFSACGYDGWVRYPCQEQENWDKPECKRPGCVVTGTCTEYLIPEGLKDDAQ